MSPGRTQELLSTPPPPAADDVHENTWYNQDFDGYRISESPLFTKRRLRVVCVGAGASGIQIAYKAEHALENIDLQIYEKNGDIGGTWLENRYPGCTCDIPSHSYQFTWDRNPNWSNYYSSSEEIWRYMKDVAVRHDLEKYIKFSTKIDSALWDEDAGKWKLHAVGPDGAEINDECDILISASGVLNSWKYPDIPGLKQYQGKLMHSAAWDESYDLTGKKVAVIGGGSSAIQIIPSIQPKVGKLVAYLRSPIWITPGYAAKYAGPGGSNFEFSAEQLRKFNEAPEEYDQYCRNVEGELNRRFAMVHRNSKEQAAAREAAAKAMVQKLNNESLAAALVPDFALGCRRPTPGPGYLESLTQDNVQVIHKSVVELTETGVIDEAGTHQEVDVVICATGFNTCFTPHFKLIGRKQADIKEQFGDFPVGYLGIAAENFPNFILLAGPNNPASQGSILPIMEWYTRYAFQVIEKVQSEGIKSFEIKPSAVKDLYIHTHELMKRMAWSSSPLLHPITKPPDVANILLLACRSWFKNGKTHGPVTAVWPGSRLHFFEMLKNVRWEDYNLEYQTGNRFQFMGNGFSGEELKPDCNPVWYFDDWFVKL
ncbi:unnamed protein product [Clonostachys chloroleuca]|uniref:Uncharacterized protein n=1 Tax=Clonostachys chloroleuca TaxID=1926264 RepID=A0AA35LPQ6_9HYPO|nr:unnamed protein product [Clonostachys chloroleuca]